MVDDGGGATLWFTPGLSKQEGQEVKEMVKTRGSCFQMGMSHQKRLDQQ